VTGRSYLIATIYALAVRAGTLGVNRRFYLRAEICQSGDGFPVMSFPWPVTDDELVLNDALEIVMRYFDLPVDEQVYSSVEKFAAEAIFEQWKLGARHKIVLANNAIAAVEERHPLASKLRRISKAS
jgi:hypothetical protein